MAPFSKLFNKSTFLFEKLTLKLEKKKDRRKQNKPQRAEDVRQEIEKDIKVNESIKEEYDDENFTNDLNFDKTAIMNDTEYDPYDDQSRKLRYLLVKHLSFLCIYDIFVCCNIELLMVVIY